MSNDKRESLPLHIMRLAEEGDTTGDYKEPALRSEMSVTLSARQHGWSSGDTFQFLMGRENQAGMRLHHANDTKGIAAAHRMFAKTWDRGDAWIARHPARDLQALTLDVIRFGEALGRRPELFTGQQGTIDWIMTERIMWLVVHRAHRLTFRLSNRQAADMAGLANPRTARACLKRLIAKGVLNELAAATANRGTTYRLELDGVSSFASVIALYPPENDWGILGHLTLAEPVHDLFVSAAEGRDSIGLTALRVYDVISGREEPTSINGLIMNGLSRNTAKRATDRLQTVGLIAGDRKSGFLATDASFDDVATNLRIPPIRANRRAKLDAKATHWRQQRENLDRAEASFRRRRGSRRAA